MTPTEIFSPKITKNNGLENVINLFDFLQTKIYTKRLYPKVWLLDIWQAYLSFSMTYRLSFWKHFRPKISNQPPFMSWCRVPSSPLGDKLTNGIIKIRKQTATDLRLEVIFIIRHFPFLSRTTFFFFHFRLLSRRLFLFWWFCDSSKERIIQ